jgi:2-polyprenyl-6-methoxyphenol hydroxylase-like FAD-dependent oxidoreductase
MVSTDPILVVGAGPVGLTLACELARRDVSVRIVDTLETPTDQSRAIVLHARSLEMLERIGVIDEIIDSGVRTVAMEMRAEGRVLTRLALDTVDSPYPFSVTTAQTETERILTARLAGLGVTVERGVTLTGLTQEPDRVRAVLRHAGGREETVSTPWLAGTDGARSTTRHLTGTALAGDFHGERFLLGDVDADHDLDRSAMHTFFSGEDGPLLVFPMRGDRMRLIAQIPVDGPAPEPTLDRLQEITDRRAGGIRIRDSRWLTVFETKHGQVPQYRIGRVLLAGDAAHVHSPAGGQGMNTGMQDAFNLGWKLALTVRGRCDDALVDSYHAERHPVGEKVIEFSTQLLRAGTLSGPVAQWLRNRALHAAGGLAPVRHALATRTEETDLSYRDSPLVGPAHRHQPVRSGDHAPDVDGTELRALLARETGHVLVTVPPARAVPPAATAPGVRQILMAATGPEGYDAVCADPERRAADRLALPRGGRVMIRPDGYVGFVTDLDDSGTLPAYLSMVLGS